MRSNGPERQQDSHVDAQLLHRIRPRAEPEARVTRDRRAAAYLRVSNSRQTASLDLQRHEVERYASENGHEIVAVYEDRGISGLTLHRRPGLSQLLFDIVAGQAAFKQVLVLDVSRWGRFQDPDEAAHYEFVCRAHHVSIVYCRDPVTDDARGSLVKQVKRVMAADYSRQISERARHGKRRAMEAGHAPGAWPRYLAGRQIIEADGDLGPPSKGRRKSLAPGAVDQARAAEVVSAGRGPSHLQDVRFRWLVDGSDRPSADGRWIYVGGRDAMDASPRRANPTAFPSHGDAVLWSDPDSARRPRSSDR